MTIPYNWETQTFDGEEWERRMKMTDTPVPAASERMTAERLAHIATVREKIEHGKIPTSMADYHLLLDGLEAIKKFEQLVAMNGADALKRFDHLATLHERIQSLERELAEWKQRGLSAEERMRLYQEQRNTLALSPQPDRAKASPDVEVPLRRLKEFAFGDRGPYDAIPRDIRAVVESHRSLSEELATLSARAEAAEARAETARAEALEEAAKVCERLDLRPDPNGRIDSDGYMIEQIDSENSRPDLAKSIRALLTAPPPTTKESET